MAYKRVLKKGEKGPLTWTQRDEILREAYRHYLTFEQFVKDEGRDVIPYAIETEPGSGIYEDISISFLDLKLAMKHVKLSKRKEEAFHLNVLRDMKQRDVAEIMGITMVSVGQYVQQAMMQLSKWYFADTDERAAIEEEATRLAEEEEMSLQTVQERVVSSEE